MSTEEEYKDWLEDVAERALMALLRNQGHVITEIEHPDGERHGRPQVQGVKTPDLKFLEDGKPVCVEFIRLSESGQHTAQAGMDRLASHMEEELGPAIAGGTHTRSPSSGGSDGCLVTRIRSAGRSRRSSR